MNFRLLIFPLFISTIIFTSCSGQFLSQKLYHEINVYTAEEDYDSAVNLLLKNKNHFTSNDALVYHMDSAMLLHLLGRFEESNQHLAVSERIIDNLYTRRISRETVSMLTSDLAVPYRGEGFEHLMLNVISALNYTKLGKWDEAAVEARRADARMRNMGKWGEDPFIRHLMGIVFENDGLFNDAYISYALSWEIYKKYHAVSNVPVSLINDLLRTAVLMGFTDRIEELHSLYPKIDSMSVEDFEKTGEIILVNMKGVIPYKIEKVFEITLGKGMAVVDSMEIQTEDQKKMQEAMTVAKSFTLGTNITVAYPKQVSPESTTIKSSISGVQKYVREESVSENVDQETYIASDLSAIAKAYFKANSDKIKSRAVARAVIKFLLAVAASKAGEAAGGKKAGGIVGLLAGVTTMAALGASEAADTRSWRTLPQEIRLARLRLEPGIYSIEVKYFIKTHQVCRKKIFENVEIIPGKATFITLRTM